ncbi:MAG: hypothetical protein KatS3mg035_1057 [Bacteroidia bacterium]|nr:MAG: hypothetical protein KatS3mg035_1057 [Bacteroidia bacterium]
MITLKDAVINSLRDAQSKGAIPCQGWIVENFQEHLIGFVQFDLFTPNFRGVVYLIHYPHMNIFLISAISHSKGEVLNGLIEGGQFITVLKMLRDKNEEVVGECAPQESEQPKATNF